MTTQEEIPEQIVGYAAASKYLGVKRNTLSSYVARGIGPAAIGHQVDGQYNLPIFTKTGLDEWLAARPGQGRRTDLVSAAV